MDKLATVCRQAKREQFIRGGIIMADKVTVYSSPSCPYCIRAKQFLKDNGVAFEDIDVSDDKEKAQEMVKKSGQMAVPVLEIDGKIIVGFDEGSIKDALGL